MVVKYSERLVILLLPLIVVMFVFREPIIKYLVDKQHQVQKTAANFKYITNLERDDGFGAQFQALIYSAIYAELNNLEFVYTPFETMAHNYDNDDSFLQ